MKKLLLFILFAGIGFGASAQTSKVDWSTTATKVKDDIYKVEIIADIADGWFIYSKDTEEGGPIPTTISLTGEGFDVEGEIKENAEKEKKYFDDIFEINIKKFGGKVIFTQLVKVDSTAPEMTANVFFASCNDQRCLPPKRLKLPVSF